MVATLINNYNYYLARYSSYVIENKSPLIKREYLLGKYGPKYRAYANGVRSQRYKHKDYGLYDSTVPNYLPTSQSINDLITKVVEGNYTYTGVKQLPSSATNNISNNGAFLFNDENRINNAFMIDDPSINDYVPNPYHWEFLNNTTLPLLEREYIYIPITSPNLHYLSSLLPSLLYWDVTRVKPYHQLIYPMQPYLIRQDITKWPQYYTLITNDCTHPFIPGFIFTGLVTVQEEGSIIYEYTDTKGWYGIPHALYVSPLKPNNLDYPLGLPKEGQLINDPCLVDLINYYPSRETMPNVGRFTGYKTTNEYNPLITFYLYERMDGSTFLSSSLPHSYARAFINQALKLRDNIEGLLLYTDLSIDSIGISDISLCGIHLGLSNRTCIPYPIITMSKLLSNCNLVDDDFGLDVLIPRVNDSAMIDDDYTLGDNICEEVLDSPFRDLYEDCLVNDVNSMNNIFLLEDCDG